MDQLKTVGSQDLTHPLEYNKKQVHTLQKEKVMHRKFKGTARVTGESVKSEEIQVSCLLWNKDVVLFNEYLSVQASYGNTWILPFVTGGWLFILLLEDGCVYSKDIFVIIGHCFGLCFKCTSCCLYIREKICWSAQSILCRGEEQGPSILFTLHWLFQLWVDPWNFSVFCHSMLYILLILNAIVVVTITLHSHPKLDFFIKNIYFIYFFYICIWDIYIKILTSGFEVLCWYLIGYLTI